MNKVLENIDACIFDMDGTLIDSMSIWREVDKEYFGRYNIEMPPTYSKDIEGLSVIEVAKYTKEHFPFPRTIDEMISDWNEMARDHYATVVCFKEGALRFLKWCRENNIKTGIATSNSKYLFNAVSEHLSFDKYIDAVVTGEDVSYGKPNPECYLKVAEKLGIHPSKCLVFEDLPLGLKAGISAGMRVVAVKDWYSESQINEKVDLAELLIDDYNSLF